jgi:hypothetical protein
MLTLNLISRFRSGEEKIKELLWGWFLERNGNLRK